jgi:hypothetical protein
MKSTNYKVHFCQMYINRLVLPKSIVQIQIYCYKAVHTRCWEGIFTCIHQTKKWFKQKFVEHNDFYASFYIQFLWTMSHFLRKLKLDLSIMQSRYYIWPHESQLNRPGNCKSRPPAPNMKFNQNVSPFGGETCRQMSRQTWHPPSELILQSVLIKKLVPPPNMRTDDTM